MAKLTNISGLDKVLRNLGKVKGDIAAGVGRGLKRGGLHLLKATNKYTPVQLGNLRNSKFIRNVGGTGFLTDIVVGFTADYAVYVHEDLEKAHGRAFNVKHRTEIAAAKGTSRGTAAGGMFERGEDQQAKFLEKPAREERRTILKIINVEARI